MLGFCPVLSRRTCVLRVPTPAQVCPAIRSRDGRRLRSRRRHRRSVRPPFRCLQGKIDQPPLPPSRSTLKLTLCSRKSPRSPTSRRSEGFNKFRGCYTRGQRTGPAPGPMCGARSASRRTRDQRRHQKHCFRRPGLDRLHQPLCPFSHRGRRSAPGSRNATSFIEPP